MRRSNFKSNFVEHVDLPIKNGELTESGFNRASGDLAVRHGVNFPKA
jgi:hypothetical protein